MRYMHIHTFALKMPPVGIELAALTFAAQNITQLKNAHAKKNAPKFYVAKTERRSAPAGRTRYRQRQYPRCLQVI